MSGALISIAVVQVLTILVGLSRAKGLALLLGPAEFGVASIIDQVVLTIASLGAVSLPFTALKFLAQAHSRDLDAFRRSGAMFVRLLAVLTMATAVVAALVFVRFPEIFGADLAPHRGIVLLGIAGLPAVMLGMLVVNVFAAARRPAAGAVYGLLSATVLAAAAIVGVVVGGMRGLYVAIMIAGAMVTIGALAWLRHAFGFRYLRGGSSPWAELRRQPDMLRYSAYIYLALGTYSLSLLLVRTSVLSELGAEAAGLMQASVSISLTIGAVLSSTTSLVLAPLVNRDLPTGEKVEAANDFLRRALVLLLVAAVPVALFPELLLRLLFSGAFVPAAASLVIFLLWQCIYQTGNVYHQLLVGLDDVLFTSTVTALGYGTAALLAPSLVVRLGLGGAALALLCGMLVRGVAVTWRLAGRWGVRLPMVIYLQIVGVALIVIVAGVLFRGLPEGTPWGMAARLAYGAITALPLWWLLGASARTAVRDRIFGPRGGDYM